MVSQSKELVALKRKWKGILLDYDYLMAQDDLTEYMVCLTMRELQVLQAAVRPLVWHTRYYSNTQEIDTDVIDLMIARIELELDGYCMPCDNFKISIDVNYAQYINTLTQNYDGTPSSVNPDAPDDYFSNSDARARALCMAVEAWVKSYVSAWLRAATAVLLLGMLGLFFFAVPVLGWIAAVCIGGLAYVAQSYVDALEDEDAIDAVICCWLDELTGIAISKAAWGTALSACVFEGGSNEQLIQSVILSEVGYDKQWVSFCDALGKAWPLAQVGILQCPCEDCITDWTRTFLGGYDSAGDWVVYSGWGTYDAGNDRFVGTNRVVAGVDDYWENVWRATIPETMITRIVVDWEYQATSATHYQIETASISKVTPTPVVTVQRNYGWSNSSGSGQCDSGEICMPMSVIQVRSTSIHPNGVMTGYTRITKIEVSGTGADPFM